MRLALAIVAPLVAGACAQTAAAPRNQVELMAATPATQATRAGANSVASLQNRGPGGITTASQPPYTGAQLPGQATNLRDAFESAYQANPTINQARANLRAADEGIAIARGGNRPTVTASVDTRLQHQREVNTPTGAGGSDNLTERRTPTQLALNVSQPLFRGFRTRNATRQAEANVRAERERLRASQQDVLLNVALAFVDVRRFRAGARFREQEVDFLREQVDAARSRQRFGEATRTDIDQAEARFAEAVAILATERSSLAEAEARFRELTGKEPAQLDRDINVASVVPATLGQAFRRAQDNNPNINIAVHEADAANFGVKTLEGETLPTVSLTGELRTDVDVNDSDRIETAEVGVAVSVPIYQAGVVSAQVRQAKENLGSARIGIDVARDQARSNIASAWATYTTAIQTIDAAQISVRAARRALEGVLEELRVGQRTTVDVLNAQQDLIRAEITQIEAIRQRDAAAFALLRATGELDIAKLGLNVVPYNPREHYAAVRDRWGGMRTPDGR